MPIQTNASKVYPAYAYTCTYSPPSMSTATRDRIRTHPRPRLFVKQKRRPRYPASLSLGATLPAVAYPPLRLDADLTHLDEILYDPPRASMANECQYERTITKTDTYTSPPPAPTQLHALRIRAAFGGYNMSDDAAVLIYIIVDTPTCFVILYCLWGNFWCGAKLFVRQRNIVTQFNFTPHKKCNSFGRPTPVNPGDSLHGGHLNRGNVGGLGQSDSVIYFTILMVWPKPQKYSSTLYSGLPNLWVIKFITQKNNPS
ncbi:hypothetical protein FB451DRAFT_1167343 [Mycena latifolia]|nr:hypothetical protein FB451DRAFT_1167343 [Mycena latifolia]